MAWIDERPNAYPDNFLPPHTDQFYPTKIPMYYDEKHRFNIDRALSKEDILKQSSSYPYLDTSKVTFADTDEKRGAHYEPDTDLSVINLKHTDPQNIDETALKHIDHETIHRTLNPVHGILAASNLLKGSIEPYGEHFGTRNLGPKRATDYNPDYNFPEDRGKSEHLLIDAIQNLDNPEFDESKLDDSLYQGFYHNYHDALLNSVSAGIFKGHKNLYYRPKWAEGFNAPGEVRRGYFGLRDLFDRSALKYKNIMKNYANRRRVGPMARQARAPDEGLGDAGIAEQIAAQDRAKKIAAIKEAVNIQIGTSRGDGSGGRARDRGRTRGRGQTEQIAGGHHFSRGGLMDIPLPGRRRDI